MYNVHGHGAETALEEVFKFMLLLAVLVGTGIDRTIRIDQNSRYEPNMNYSNQFPSKHQRHPRFSLHRHSSPPVFQRDPFAVVHSQLLPAEVVLSKLQPE